MSMSSVNQAAQTLYNNLPSASTVVQTDVGLGVVAATSGLSVPAAGAYLGYSFVKSQADGAVDFLLDKGDKRFLPKSIQQSKIAQYTGSVIKHGAHAVVSGSFSPQGIIYDTATAAVGLLTGQAAAGVSNAAQDGDEIPGGLCLALQEGQHDTVAAFMKVLAELLKEGKLSEDKFIELAAAKDGDEIPGLFLAQKSGQHDTVAAFMKVLAELLKEGKLSEGKFIALAAAKGGNETPGLFLALQNGRNEVVTAFMTVLAELLREKSLSEEAFKELAAAKSGNETFGLFMAQECHYHKTVNAFMSVLDSLGRGGSLSVDALTELKKRAKPLGNPLF
ncbi:hypothetical protein JQC92_20985 [Shewanella sp. 202IG2-18]|uniref:hypothetical protein n=1 Tax=Parashewanella hymeniacidonis TaxID=2807618 RepID=UPI0019605D80|nr:hypothetical protein [Parashewanella hymeniacidonis]MBM7074465.1 hypothetical protein [Parashewanella hymeniacidonis]